MFFKPLQVNIGDLKVNNADHLGSISFGNTEKIGRNVKGKKTQGFGQQHADFVLRGFNAYYVLDNELIDKFTTKINK